MIFIWCGLVAYVVLVAWISINHNLRTTWRQVFVFHPWCDAGGGGEKCLWLAVKEFAERAAHDMEQAKTYQSSGGRIRYKKPIRFVILCHGTTPHVQDLLNDVDRNFGIKIPSNDSWPSRSRDSTRLSEFVAIRLVRLHSASLSVKVYPFATQFLQMAAGLLVSFEASLKTRGNRYDTIWDTTGLATTVFLFNWLTTMFRRRTYTYVHYPFISSGSFPDEGRCPPSAAPPSLVRQVYTKLLNIMYYVAGSCYRQPIPVNSTYTLLRLGALWPKRNLLKCLPPVDSPELPPGTVAAGLTLENATTPGRGVSALEQAPTVISVAQFRKEKRHFFQIQVIRHLLEAGRLPGATKFLICGSCRPKSSSQDRSLLLGLLNFADELCGAFDIRIELHCHSKLDWVKWAPSRCVPHAKYSIEFHVNSNTKQLKRLIASASVGLHTMIDEHLGISVAEMALNRLFVVAHNSGGPRDDILKHPDEEEWRSAFGEDSGFDASDKRPLGALCESVAEFSEAIEWALRARSDSPWRVVDEVRALASAVVRGRFPSSQEYGVQLLNTWGLYAKQ